MATPEKLDIPLRVSNSILAELAHFGVNFRPAGSTGPISYNELNLLHEPFIGYIEVDAGDGLETYLVCRNYTPIDFKPAGANMEFASYLAPVGQLISQRAGASVQVLRRFVALKNKAQFSPIKDKENWDARHARIGWGRHEVTAESLKALVTQIQASQSEEVDEQLIPLVLDLKQRRSVLQVTQLPDRAILDDVQDPIFRHPLAGAILITGAPGTGKTTVQIKRLAQKTKWDFLTEQERVGLDRASWTDNEGWLFFTPTVLLKSYLKEALAKERLAASDANVKVWRDYQVELLRIVRFLRVKDTDDGFRRAPESFSILKDTSSESTSAVANAFYNWMSAEIDSYVRVTADLPDGINYPINVLSERRRDLSKEVNSKLGYAPLFRRIPRLYSQFRKDPAFRNKFYRTDAITSTAIEEARLDAQEMSILLYASLKWVRATWESFEKDDSSKNTGGPSYLLRDQKLIIAIDEASDFSVVEIAAMALLADPRKSSVSLSGDLMQRLTSTGLRSWDELSLLGLDVPRFELRRAYRQTDRLARLAGKLYTAFSGDTKTPTDSVNHAENDPPVLVQPAPTPEAAAIWIGKRVQEIYELNAGNLPSIGVLMPTEQEVEPFSKLLQAALFDSSIDVEASLNGQNLGNTAKVRVFCVDHIKGLEFESVFFCDIDVMAEKQKDLIDRFVYVGLSRARTFLGMTYRSAFPSKLGVIKDDLLFSERFAAETKTQPWRSYLDEDEVAQFNDAEVALLDTHFRFYWDVLHGHRSPKTSGQKTFVRYMHQVTEGKAESPRNQHEAVFRKFLELRALRGPQ